MANFGIGALASHSFNCAYNPAARSAMARTIHVHGAQCRWARIYLSFADEDRPRVMDLVRWLNDSGWQVRADDRHAFATGEGWGRAAARRLNSCDVILCVITPGWLVSTFCHREFSYCAKRGKFVLPVLCELTDVALLRRASARCRASILRRGGWSTISR